MAEVKSKSLIELLNIDTDDLKTPLHDKLMFWLQYNWREVIDEKINGELHLEYTIMSNKFVIGSIDAVVFTDLRTYIGFEIKSSIQSYGELIRQVNIYRSSMTSLGYRCLYFMIVIPFELEDEIILNTLSNQNIYIHTVSLRKLNEFVES